MEDSNHLEEASAAAVSNNSSNNNNNYGWQKVTYAKRRKNQQQKSTTTSSNGTSAVSSSNKDSNVFRSIEQQAEDRHLRIVEAQRKIATLYDEYDDAPKSRSKKRDDSDDNDSDSDTVNVKINEKDDSNKEKKKKKKVDKKPKVSVSEAAAKMDASDLAAFLLDLSGSYESQEDIQLMRFADYYARAFSGVTSAQFPWVKIFKESPVAKLAEIPVSHIPDAVYRTSVDWINQRSVTALSSFVILLLDSILADLNNQISSSKNTKKPSQPPPSKSQIAIFVVLAMVLRRKPDVLVSLLPSLRENNKYQGQEKLPVFIWMISQACQGDLAVGLFASAHNLLPMLNNKSTNPLCRDLILQLIERILAAPKARSILVNGAVRKGERLIPPAEFDILMRATFPVSSAKIKATERFETVYPILKEVALAGITGSKAMKQVALQMFSFAILAAGEGKSELGKEATDVIIWCLAQNSDIYKQWDKVYLDNLEASVAVLKKLSEEMRGQHVNQSSLDVVKQTLKSFQQKNEKTLAGESSGQATLLKDGDKHCKVMLGRLSRGHGCVKAMVFVAVAMTVGAAVMSSNVESFDWKRVSVMLSSFQSF